MTAARRVAAEVRAAHPDVEVRITGVVFMNDSFKQATLRDIRFLAPLMYLGVAFAVLLLTRSLVAALMTMLVMSRASAFCQRTSSPTPFKKIPRAITVKCVAGSSDASNWSHEGMLTMGKKISER